MRTLAIIVNYKSAPLTLQAVRSVTDSESLGPVSVAVVDNSESPEEAERLRRGLPTSVNLMVNAQNVGFGRACNRAAEPWRGEAILLINPDAKVLPGCLKRLQQTLFSCKAAAAVSPQIFWDEFLQYYFPPPCSPGLVEFQSSLGPQDGGYITRLLDVLWRRHAIRLWGSESPSRVRNLSGGLVLLKCACVREAGGLFDPRFFLYFEDTDLFLRLRRTGFDLLIEPRSRAIHYYDQCAREEQAKKRGLMLASMALFREKHGTTWKGGLARAISGFVPAVRDQNEIFPYRFSKPFTIEIPASMHEGWLFEWSPNRNFLPAAGRFGAGAQFEFSEERWDMLAKGQYYGRIGRLKGYGRRFLNMTWVVE